MIRKLIVPSMIALLAAFTFVVAPAFAADPPVVAIPIVNANQGETVDVPVTVDTRGIGIRGYGINLDFDPTVIEIDSFTDAGFLGDCPGGTVYVGTVLIDNTAGTLKGASATYLGCPTKSVSTAPGSSQPVPVGVATTSSERLNPSTRMSSSSANLARSSTVSFDPRPT
jgi:hypothetical protein